MAEARAQYVAAADMLARGGDAREALEVLRRIADLDPSNTQVRLRLAESYAAAGLPDLAAEAYTLAGERLAARREFEQALEAFTKALALLPASHLALAGLLSAHTELGTADEAAEILEQVAVERPADLEVRAMLVRAYVEAENAIRAEDAARELVARDPSSFTLYFEVIRLYLRQDNVAEAVRLLGHVCDPALSGRQESSLTELLQEAVTRDPEQLEAHRLLARAYTALHDDTRLRSALERLADSADSAGDNDEQRRASRASRPTSLPTARASKNSAARSSTKARTPPAPKRCRPSRASCSAASAAARRLGRLSSPTRPPSSRRRRRSSRRSRSLRSSSGTPWPSRRALTPAPPSQTSMT